jgi:hypothetical protein
MTESAHLSRHGIYVTTRQEFNELEKHVHKAHMVGQEVTSHDRLPVDPLPALHQTNPLF